MVPVRQMPEGGNSGGTSVYLRDGKNKVKTLLIMYCGGNGGCCRHGLVVIVSWL